MKAYRFLREDMRGDWGKRVPWEVGEERTIASNRDLRLSGFSSSPTLWDALQWAAGPMACLLEVPEPLPLSSVARMQASAACKLLKAVNVQRQLQLFAADCVERVCSIWEEAFEGDDRPRRLIEEVRGTGKEELSEWLRLTWNKLPPFEENEGAYSVGLAAICAHSTDIGSVACVPQECRLAVLRASGPGATIAEIEWQQNHFNEMFSRIFEE